MIVELCAPASALQVLSVPAVVVSMMGVVAGLGVERRRIFRLCVCGVALIRTPSPLDGGTGASNALVRWEAVEEIFFRKKYGGCNGLPSS